MKKEHRPTLREQIENKCVHFNGMMNDTCKAGVDYDSVKVAREPGKGWDLPCFKDRKPCSITCDKQQFPTAEYVQARLDEIEQSSIRTFGAIAAIQKHANGKRGVAAVIECPACKGDLHYSIAGVNGHIHARCSTPNCVAFMQ